MKRFFATPTREELRQAIQDSNEANNRVIDQRHKENLERMAAQDRELREIRSAVGRIEGQISGRYPKVQ